MVKTSLLQSRTPLKLAMTSNMDHLKVIRKSKVFSSYRTLIKLDLITLIVYLVFGTSIVWSEWNKDLFTPALVAGIPAAIWLLAWMAFAAGVLEVHNGNKTSLSRWNVASVGIMATIGMVLHLMILYVMTGGFT